MCVTVFKKRQSEFSHKHTGKQRNQRIVTASVAANEISVGAAAVTMTVLAKPGGIFALKEAQKGTNGFS